MTEDEARRRVKKLERFYKHLGVFIAVHTAFLLINVMTYLNGAPEIWFAYTLSLWGPFVGMHAWATFRWFGNKSHRDWKAEKIRELMGWSATQEELARLTDRVDALLTIMSSHNLESLDAKLADSKVSLINARKIIGEQQSEERTEKQVLVELVERLEATVTSPEFRHFDEIQTTEKSK